MIKRKKFKKTVGGKVRDCVAFYFGKIKDEKGRRTLEVKVTISLDQEDNFSATAEVWNASCTDIIMGGQCFDSINVEDLLPEYRSDFQIIRNLWRMYHLNNMKAGSPRQRAFLEINKEKLSNGEYYKTACELLKEAGLYEDEEYLHPYKNEVGNTTLKPYRYGSAWLKEEIPEKDIEFIRKLIA